MRKRAWIDDAIADAKEQVDKEETTHDLYSREIISSKESIVKDYDFSTGEMNDYRIGRARP